MPTQENPVLVEVRRGDCVESRHRGSVVAVDAGGQTLFSAGCASSPIYPRSALKILQAIPLVESGAAERFGLSDAEITLACASHNAEDMHTRAVLEWLHRLGLGEDDLECGPARAYKRGGKHGDAKARVNHNCSGKHAGMMTMAMHIGAPLRGYSDYAHPCQQRWMQTLSALIGEDVFAMPWERDGCGLPALCMPLEYLARAHARIANQTKILTAIRAHPQLLAGANRCCTAVIHATAGTVIAKTGAEGVYAGAIPARKIGFALKIEDGATRAAEAALGALLKKLGALDADAEKELQPYFRPAILNSQNYKTGVIIALPLGDD